MEALMYVLYFGLGIGGIILHLALKIKSLERKSAAAHEPFSTKQFLIDDKWTILGNLTTIIVLLAFVPELKTEFDKSYYLKASFLLMGYFGSDIAHRLFSAANKKINLKIEDKTTEAELNK